MKTYRHVIAALITSVIGSVGLSIAVPAAASAASWDPVASDCHNGGVSGWSEYTWCWSKKKRINDNTPNIDIYAFRMTLSGNATSGEWMNRLWVEMDPRSTSPAMSWHSADPFKPDDAVESSGDCRNWTWTIGAAVGIVSGAYSESGSVCAKTIYTPKRYSEDGHHAAVLNKSNCWSAGVVKKVAASVLVRTGQGKVPLWDSSKHGMYVRNLQSGCSGY